MKIRICLLPLVILLISPLLVFASAEGTRHITGSGMDLYFMNDKVFGTANNNPLWAVYNCGTSIKGEMDIKGKYYSFAYAYHQKKEQIITGHFGPVKMSMENIKKNKNGFLYEVIVNTKKHIFSISYEKVQSGHMLNSVIQGSIDKNNNIYLETNGRLCPFATTGIIMIAVGSAYITGSQ